VTSAINIATSDWDEIEKLCLLDQLLGDLLRKQKELSKATAVLLAKQQELWDDLGPDTIYALWEELRWSEEPTYSFQDYAMHRTGFRWTTLINLIRTARVWFLQNVKVPEKIRLLNPATDEPLKETVSDFDPSKADMSKLLLLASVQQRGDMTEKEWGLLANPDTTHRQLRRHLMNSKSVKFKRRIICQDGMLVVMVPALDEALIFGSLEIDSTDPDISWAVEKTLMALNAKVC